jgi:FkbM family methyltransferase
MRSVNRVVRAIFQPNHWLTFFKSFLIIDTPIQFLRRYIFNSGSYPWCTSIRTPVGKQIIELQRFEDIFTITEIFLWEVYRSNGNVRNFVDIGGNVGFASLYFLTRSNDSRGFLVEPLSQNMDRAKKTLSKFGDRIECITAAVSIEDGTLEIGVEPTGRYSGVDCLETGLRQTFVAIGINRLLTKVINELGDIDVVKIDCEGAEQQFMPKISHDNLQRVWRFVIESRPLNDENLVKAGFEKKIVFDDAAGGYVLEYCRDQ